MARVARSRGQSPGLSSQPGGGNFSNKTVWGLQVFELAFSKSSNFRCLSPSRAGLTPTVSHQMDVFWAPNVCVFVGEKHLLIPTWYVTGGGYSHWFPKQFGPSLKSDPRMHSLPTRRKGLIQRLFGFAF